MTEEWYSWSRILYTIRSVAFNSCLRMIFHTKMLDSALSEQKYAKMPPFLPKNRQFLAQILPVSSAFVTNISFLGSSLNAEVVFNLTRAAQVT